MPIKSTLESFAGELRTAGFTVSVDPAELSPSPVAVWLQPRAVSGLTLSGGGTLTTWCYLICGNYDVPQVLGLLDDALSGLLDLETAAVVDGDAIDLAAAVLLPNMTTPLPAYRVAVELPVDNL